MCVSTPEAISCQLTGQCTGTLWRQLGTWQESFAPLSVVVVGSWLVAEISTSLGIEIPVTAMVLVPTDTVPGLNCVPNITSIRDNRRLAMNDLRGPCEAGNEYHYMTSHRGWALRTYRSASLHKLFLIPSCSHTQLSIAMSLFWFIIPKPSLLPCFTHPHNSLPFLVVSNFLLNHFPMQPSNFSLVILFIIQHPTTHAHMHTCTRAHTQTYTHTHVYEHDTYVNNVTIYGWQIKLENCALQCNTLNRPTSLSLCMRCTGRIPWHNTTSVYQIHQSLHGQSVLQPLLSNVCIGLLCVTLKDCLLLRKCCVVTHVVVTYHWS